jgi:hypothetical protein
MRPSAGNRRWEARYEIIRVAAWALIQILFLLQDSGELHSRQLSRQNPCSLAERLSE